jgi:hypothetical protein
MCELRVRTDELRAMCRCARHAPAQTRVVIKLQRTRPITRAHTPTHSQDIRPRERGDERLERSAQVAAAVRHEVRCGRHARSSIT